MNLIGYIILFSLVFGFLLSICADYLNISNLKASLPEEVKDIYEAEKYKKSQDYLRETTQLELFSGGADLIIVLLFWFAAGFNNLDYWLRSFGWGPVTTGIFFISILMFGQNLLSLPFRIYSTFVIEEKFGFNKMDMKTFWTDTLKSILLTCALGIPILTGILSFLEYAKVDGWLYCWIATISYMMILQFIAPTWIMPLFNKFEPLEDGQLKEAILSYSKSVSFPLKNIYVMDGSKRSSKSNAFFTGFGKNKRIALFDTLLKGNNVKELVSIIAHEIGHYKKKHIYIGMASSIIHMGFLFFLLSIFLKSPELFSAFYMEEMSVYAGLIFFGMLFTPIELFLSIFLQRQSRKHEFEADQFAAETIGQTEPLITALKKLCVQNLSNLTPHPFYVFLNYSHPPLLHRIDAIKKLEGSVSVK
jgi:STE24 endopeptidase